MSVKIGRSSALSIGLVDTGLVFHVLSLSGKAHGAALDDRIGKAVATAAAAHHVPRRILAAIIMQESSNGRNTKSRTGDLGVGQISPRTADWLGFDKRRLVADIEYNIDCAASYLAYLKKRHAPTEPKRWFLRYHSSNLVLQFKYKTALRRWEE